MPSQEKSKPQEEVSTIRLTIRLLVTSTSTWTAKLLGLTAPRVSDKKSTVVTEEDVLDLLLGSLVDIC